MDRLLDELKRLNKVIKQFKMYRYIMISDTGKVSLIGYHQVFGAEAEEKLGIIGDIDGCIKRLTEIIRQHETVAINPDGAIKALYPDD